MINRKPTPQHLFVSGPPRSGTTLLRLILSAHPQITVAPEAHITRLLLKNGYSHTRALSDEEKMHILGLLTGDSKLSRWPGLNQKLLIQRIQEIEVLTIPGLLDALFLEFARLSGSGTAYIGHKKGDFTNGFAADMKRLFPEARFIVIVRDSRDIVRSVLSNFEGQDLDTAVKYCSVRNIHIQNMRNRFPGDVQIVRYEDLVLDPFPTVKSLCEWLELPYVEGMLDYYKMNKENGLLLEGTEKLHENTRYSLNSDLLEQWNKPGVFSSSEIKFIETRAYDYMSSFGYEPVSDLSPIKIRLQRLRTALGFWKHRLQVWAVKNYHLLSRKINNEFL